MEPLDTTVPILIQQAQPVQTGPESFIVHGTEQQPKKRCCCSGFFAKKMHMRVWLQTFHFLMLVELFCFMFFILGLYPFTIHSWTTILTIFIMPFLAYPAFLSPNRKVTAAFLSAYSGAVFMNGIFALMSFIMLFLWRYWTIPLFIGLIVKSSLAIVSFLSFAETVRMAVIEKKEYQKENATSSEEASIDSLPEDNKQDIHEYPAVPMDMPSHTENASSSFFTDINNNNLVEDQKMSAFIPNHIQDNNVMYAQEDVQNAPLLIQQQTIPFETQQQQLYNMGYTDYERNAFYLNQYSGDVGLTVSGLSKSAIPQTVIPFETEMGQLYEMGFTDFEKNTFFLAKFNGDIQQVLAAYVQ